MPLWTAWFDVVRALRPASRRFHTFLWMILVLVGLSCRPERAGVTSLVRLFGYGNRGYRRFLHLFHSRTLETRTLLDKLALLLFSLAGIIDRNLLLVADAYYASGKMFVELLG
jgi:hypothetical protein